MNPESGGNVVRVDKESGQVVQSPGTPKSLKVDGGCDKRPEKTNLLCDVTNCSFETGFYGVMNQSRKTRLMVEVTSKSDKTYSQVTFLTHGVDNSLVHYVVWYLSQYSCVQNNLDGLSLQI